MFIRQTHLARMFKKAYKGVGLRIIRDKDGNQMELYKTDKRQDIYKAAMDAQASGNMIYSTGMILANGLDEMFRVYKGEENNHYLVPEVSVRVDMEAGSM